MGKHPVDFMNNAFAQCMNMELTATDSRIFPNVTDVSMMFNNAYNFKGAPSMANGTRLPSRILNTCSGIFLRHQ
jgi:ABC-type transporter lipoprotein component MlaA